MAYQVMGLNKKEKEELKKLLRVNSPVPSQKKRINFLKSRQKPSTKSKKPLDDKTSQSQENIRKLRKRITERQLDKKKKPIVKPKPIVKSKKPLDDKTSQSQENIRKLRKTIRQNQLAKTTNKTQKDMSKNKKVDQSSYTKPQPSTAGLKAKTIESPLVPKAKKKTIDQEGGVAQGLPLKAKKKVPDYTPKGNKAMLKKKDSDTKFVKRIEKAIRTPAKKSIRNMKTINDGDTLSGIASKYGTTVKKLMELNSDTIKDPDKIYAGRKINVGAVPSTALGAINKDKPVLGGRGKITRKKGGTVFRRGGGQALRGFGKATYSNKMY